MGCVCSGGMSRRKSGFRVKDMGASGRKTEVGDQVVAAVHDKEEKKKEREVIRAFPIYESGAMTSQPRFDYSGELNSSISRELKPSTHGRMNGTTKV